MKYLLTGGNGYIGSHLAMALLRSGHDVRALIYKGTDSEALRKAGAEVSIGDIRDYKSVELAAKGCDAVFHLASYVGMWAKDPEIFHEVNVTGTRTLLDVCRNLCIRRVLICSSCGIFGPSHNGAFVDETQVNSNRRADPYDVSKFNQVELAKKYLHEGIEVVFVYPTRVFGPGIHSDGNSLTRIFEGVVNGTWKIKFGNGKNIGNYVFIKDVVNGMLLVMYHGRAGEGYILGGHNLTYNHLFEILQSITGKSLHLRSIPVIALRLVGIICELYSKWTGKKPFITLHWATKFTSDWKVSNKKIRQLGFYPTPVQEALEWTIDSISGKTSEDMYNAELENVATDMFDKKLTVTGQ